MTDSQPKHPHVLFVDDEPDFLRVATDTFNELSGGRWQIHHAVSADTALELLARQPVDLVVVDINMPMLDGVQLLRILGRRHPELKKVTLTGYATEAKRTECLANGAELFIEKPRNQQGYKSIFLMLDELVTWTPQQGFRGMLRQVGLSDVLQMECLGRNSSILEVRDGRRRGRICIENGNIIHAELDGSQGEKAFNQILAIAGGDFQIHPFEAPEKPTIEGSWEFLLMEAARMRDELASQPAKVPDTAADAPPAEPPPEVAVAETLVCLPSGEPLYQSQCADALARVALMQTVAQQAGLLAQALPLGKLQRLEILQPGGRTVINFNPNHLVFVRVASLVPHA